MKSAFDIDKKRLELSFCLMAALSLWLLLPPPALSAQHRRARPKPVPQKRTNSNNAASDKNSDNGEAGDKSNQAESKLNVFKQQLHELLARPEFAAASIGVRVTSQAGDRVLFEQD